MAGNKTLQCADGTITSTKKNILGVLPKEVELQPTAEEGWRNKMHQCADETTMATRAPSSSLIRHVTSHFPLVSAAKSSAKVGETTIKCSVRPMSVFTLQHVKSTTTSSRAAHSELLLIDSPSLLLYAFSVSFGGMMQARAHYRQQQQSRQQSLMAAARSSSMLYGQQQQSLSAFQQQPAAYHSQYLGISSSLEEALVDFTCCKVKTLIVLTLHLVVVSANLAED
ncbi:hypothetical protein FXO38_02022 [Capsicum annuum]|nr:hypothetical protein FXO37_03318 [Capsicum annuum]KAF3680892.1 hypothetical protein FXO38_02022 [Capsicum annuum]